MDHCRHKYAESQENIWLENFLITLFFVSFCDYPSKPKSALAIVSGTGDTSFNFLLKFCDESMFCLSKVITYLS